MLDEERKFYHSPLKTSVITLPGNDVIAPALITHTFDCLTSVDETVGRPPSAPANLARSPQVPFHLLSGCKQRPHSSPGLFPFSDSKSKWRRSPAGSLDKSNNLSMSEMQDIRLSTVTATAYHSTVRNLDDWDACQLSEWLLSSDNTVVSQERPAAETPCSIQNPICLLPTTPSIRSPSMYRSCLREEPITVPVPRADLKRPRSAVSSYTDSPLTEDESRPFSAPKRLYNDGCDSGPSLFASRTTLSFVTSDSITLVNEQAPSGESDPPKSTLEALVASNSPMLFFTADYTAAADRITSPLCDLIAASTEKSRTPLLDNYDTVESNFNLDLESTCTDVESDILNLNSAANSISSSKSLASVDLGEANVMKGSDSHNTSPTSNLSASSEALSNGCVSITTHLSAFVEAIRSYAAELCPVDCVILMERCRPFNCDTYFMKYFREQYLCPILSNLNGGPPLNADFGRDAYTSLYSLHGFYWRKPFPSTTWVPDTPIIYRILKRIATLQHEERHASDQTDLFKGTSGCRLLESAVQAFDAIDKARRGLCKQVQRHLLLLAVSPINVNDLYADTLKPLEDNVLKEPLTNLRRRRVALSVFSPVRSPSLLRLYELVNGSPPSLFCDRRWQTVALSVQLLNSDSPERRIVGPLAADSHAQAEAELVLMEQQQKHMHQQQMQQPPPPPHESPNGHYDPREPRLVNSPIPSSRPTVLLPRSNSLSGVHTTVAVSDHQPVASLTVNSAGTPTESMYRSVGRTTVHNHNGTSALSPMMQLYQNSAAESMAPQNARSSRNPGHNHGSTPTGYVSRVTGHRLAVDGNRQLDQSAQHMTVSVNSVSAGHSGPNSVDQFGPASVYGSDSVTTPQGCSAGIMSPQQPYLASASMTQLHSPASGGAVVGVLHSTTPVTPNTVPAGAYPTYSQQYQQQTGFDGSGSLSGMRPIQTAPLSPSASQMPFRPPSSNAAASPGGHFANYPNSTGLPSPSGQRGSASRQYSPQFSTQLQGSHQRHTSPHPGLSQSVRTHHSSPMDNLGSAAHSRSRSITPTNFAPAANSLPVSNPYAAKENHHSNTTGPVSWNTTGGGMPSHFSGPGNPASSAYDPQLCRPSGALNSSGYVSPDHTMPGGCRPCTHGFGGSMANGPVTMHRDVSNVNLKMHDASARRVDTVPPMLGVSGPPAKRQQSSPLEQLSISRSLLWEGEAQLVDSNTATPTSSFFGLRLLVEQTGARDISQLNMQLWGHSTQLSIILVPRDSTLVSQLTGPVSGGYLLAWVLVELPQPDEACRLTAALSNSISPTALPLGILSPPPNAIPNPVPPGTIAFVCLSYSPKRNRIYGLIPSDSEQFRNDLPSRHSVRPLGSDIHGTGNSLQRVYAPSPTTAVSRSHAVVPLHEDQLMQRTAIPPSLSQPSFIQQDPFLCYSGVQRNPSLSNTGSDPTGRLPPHYSSTPPNRSYTASQQPIHCHSNPAIAQSLPGTAPPTLRHQPTQQLASLPTTLRNTPSPLTRDGRHAPMMPDAQPPPQWIASQADFPLHSSQQPLPSRGLKSVHAQQQQQQLSQYSSIPNSQLINNNNAGQPYPFHSQLRIAGDRFAPTGVVTGGAVSASCVVSQPMMMGGDVVGGVDHRPNGSPQLCISSSHSTHARFVNNNGTIFQNVPSNNAPSSYGLSAMGSQTSSNVSSGYNAQACAQRVVYPNQVGSQHLMSPSGSLVYPSSAVDGCYQTRGLPPTSLSGASNYRFGCDSSNGTVSLMTTTPQQQPSRSMQVPMSKQHLLAQQQQQPQHTSLDGSGFQALPNRMIHCGLMMSGDMMNVGNTSQSNFASNCHDFQPQQPQQHHHHHHQQQQQSTHMTTTDPSFMYSSVRFPHSTYDGTRSSDPTGFY